MSTLGTVNEISPETAIKGYDKIDTTEEKHRVKGIWTHCRDLTVETKNKGQLLRFDIFRSIEGK